MVPLTSFSVSYYGVEVIQLAEVVVSSGCWVGRLASSCEAALKLDQRPATVKRDTHEPLGPQGG